MLDDTLTDSSDTSSLHSVTPSIADALFRQAEGKEYQNLNDIYLWPFDPQASHYERLSLELKIIVSGGLVPGGPAGEIASRLVDVGERSVLDVGCGVDGLWVQGMGRSFPRASIIGLDLVPVQLSRSPPNVSFEVWDVVQGLPFQYDQFDAIRVASLGPFLPDYPFLINECLRCLKPGGSLLVLEPEGRLHIGSRTIDWLSMQTKSSPSPSPSPHHFFDALLNTVQTARAPPSYLTSSLPATFCQIEERTWMTPVGLHANLEGCSRRRRRLSQIKTTILLLFLRSQLLDPSDNSTRTLAQSHADLAQLERVLSGNEDASEVILSGFRTVWAKKGSGVDNLEVIKLMNEEEIAVVTGMGGMALEDEEVTP